MSFLAGKGEDVAILFIEMYCEKIIKDITAYLNRIFVKSKLAETGT